VVRGRHVCLVMCLAMFLLMMSVVGGANDEEEAPESCASELRGEYLGQSTPGSEPVRFAPSSLCATGSVWWVSAPVFSADGGLVVWTRYHVGDRDPDYKDVVFVEQEESGCWTQPEAVSSSDGHDDAHAAFVPGTNGLLLISDRPGGPLFRIERTSDEWTEPSSVPISIPLDMGHQITISETGTLYFRMTDDGNMDLYRSGVVDGRYESPQSLGNTINTASQEYGPWIRADEAFILFASDRPGGYGRTDLYVSFRISTGDWGQPINLGPSINTASSETLPSLSPDGKYLFFISRRRGDAMYNPYWVSAEAIEQLGPNSN